LTLCRGSTQEMEQYGNAKTFNIDSVIVQNIKGSLYYAKNALDLDTPYELIDEIFEKCAHSCYNFEFPENYFSLFEHFMNYMYRVDHVEPWLSGNARGPSTAFCLLFRLGQLRPEPSVIRDMLDHRDSPFIRAVGYHVPNTFPWKSLGVLDPMLGWESALVC